MKRALNNKEKSTMKVLKDLGYNPVVRETLDWRGEASYYAEVYELKAWISLSSPGDMSDIPHKKAVEKNII